MSNNYVSIHTHSYYSMLDGLSSPEEYMKRASELGMNALAITDHGNVSGWLDFYEAGQKYGVKPLLGAELYQARQTRFHRDEIERSNKKATQEYGQSGPHHITMIAKNYDGYKNLLKMSSKAYTESFYVKPRVDLELLAEYSKGVIATSGCVSGKIPSALLRDDFDYALETAGTMKDILGKENFFIEVQDHGLEDQRRVMTGLIDIANRLDLKIIATPDAHYAYPDQSEIHDVLLAIGTGARVHDEDRFKFPADKFYLPSYEELAQIFDKQWLQNTNDLAEMCELELNFDQLYFPHFEVPGNQDPTEYFEQEVYKGLKQKYDEPLSEEVTQRAEYEMDVIKRMGFVEYFLIVADVVNWCDRQGIRTGPRGSAASSICSYALGITKIDPLYFALRFERFLTFGRGSSAPDIDLDIDDRYRGQVIEYTRQKYGEDHVSHIGTFAGVKARSAIRDVARVLDYSYQKGDEVAKMIPEPVQGFTYSIDEALDASKDLALAYDRNDDTKEIIDKARGIEGVVRQSGIHAGGIVISQAPMIEHVPVMQRPDKTGKPGPMVTQWEDDRVEQVGLLKMDYLGLKNLAIIGRCFQSIQDRHGLELSEHNIPWDDGITYEMLRNGESLGCFQIEGPQMRELMMGIQPDRIEDLAALVALYRPGPMGSGLDKEYVERKQGRKESRPAHPLLEDSLKRSHNLMIYQEQVLDAARILAGFDPQERETLRKALGKKKREVVNELREKFVTQCWEVNGIAEDEASRIYDQIEYFGAYSFNLAHAASYGFITYITAYLKANYPVDYMAAVLTTTKTKDAMAPYLNECRRMGLHVVPPSVNRSQNDFVVEDDQTIVFGLDSVDGIGAKVTDEILKARKDQPFESLYDFIRRVPSRVLDRRVFVHLAASGAFDELLHNTDNARLSHDDIQRVLSMEYQELGTYVSQHPVEDVKDILQQEVTCNLDRLVEYNDGDIVTVGGVIIDAQKKVTKKNKDMWLLHVEDLTASIPVLVFAPAANDYHFEVSELVLIKGRVTIEGGDNQQAKLILQQRDFLPKPQHPDEQPLLVMFDETPSYEDVQSLAAIGWNSHGPASLRFKIPYGDNYVTMEIDDAIDKQKVKTEFNQKGYKTQEMSL